MAGSTKDSSSKGATAAEPESKKKKRDESGAQRARRLLATAIWLLAVLAALLLAVGALVVALGFNTDHPLVDFVISTAERIDLGELKSFEGSGDDVRTKWALVNWGIASVAYLVVGKVLDRLIRP